MIEVLGCVPRVVDEALLAVLDTVGIQIALAELRDRAELRSDIAQKELEEARERLEAIMACAPAYIASVGRDDTVLFLNRPWPLLGAGQAVGESWRPLADPKLHAELSTALAKVFSSGEYAFHHVAINDAEGRPRWFSNHVGPVRLGGQLVAAVVISQDITQAKLAQAELADAQRLASVGTLAAGMAHEINTPVQFVSDSFHFLRDAMADLLAVNDELHALLRVALSADPSGGDLQKAAATAARAAEDADLDYLRENVPGAFARALDGLERVARIVRSMKEFSHPQQAEKAPADLNRAIESTLTVATNEYKYVADLETELGELPNVQCHVNDINQVVLNIVVNAAHAIGDRMKEHGRGRITVRTERAGDDVVIAISDTGGGIPKAIQTRIFDPFFTTKEVGRGTGQGLAIARSIVEEKHHGTLTFESQAGVGTTFFIRLPAA